jgi:hypothetical protein
MEPMSAASLDLYRWKRSDDPCACRQAVAVHGKSDRVASTMSSVEQAINNARKPRHAGNTSLYTPKPLKPPPAHHIDPCDTHRHNMSFPGQPHGGPAGAPPNMAHNFNAMLQRSMDSPQPENAVEAPGQPPSGPGTAQFP